MTEATLGFKIDSTPASSAAADLDKLTASATRTTQAVDKLEAEAAGLGAALGKAGDDARKALPAVDGLGRSFGSQDDHVRAFRMEVERLTLKFRPLAQATQQYEATVTEIQRAHKLGAITAQEMTTALDRERQAFERLKTSATAAGSAVKAANSNRGGAQSFNSANAAFQFQDIAVTAAMGMNPLMIGLQQGTQLASVVGSMEKPVSGLASAFGALINPISLSTIALTAGSAALIQYFTTAESGTEKTNRLFEEQNDIIRRAAALWGDAAPQLKAYVDELDRADKITQGREASSILAGRELEEMGAKLEGLRDKAITAFSALRARPGTDETVRALGYAWDDLRERVAKGTATVADFDNAKSTLAAAIEKEGLPALKDFSKSVDAVTASFYRSLEAARKAQSEWIKSIAGADNVQDIISGSTFTEGGRTFRSADFVPFNAPTPGRRPNIELSGDPDPDRILNSDGRLTDIPVPGRRPNFFELEEQKEKIDDVTKAYRQAQDAKADFWLDISYQERQAERSAMDRQVANTLTRYGFNEDLNSPEANAIRQGLQREEAKEAFKGFFQGIHDEAWSNGGKIGDAIVKSALNAAQKASEKAWEGIFDKLATAATNWLMGGSSLSSPSFASSGVSGATTTLGSLLGYGGAANDNRSVGGISAYATAIQSIESSGNYGALGPVTRNGDRAYGAYQVMGNNIGPWSQAALGRTMSASEFLTDKGAQDAIFAHRFGGYVDKYGASGAAQAWFGGPGSVGKGGMGADVLGTTGNTYVAKFNGALEKASGSLGQFGNGLGQLGTTLASGAAGGGGGLLSALSGIGRSIFASSGQFASAWMGGGIGLYANGTNNAPGGLSIVGERGPELLNLPQGSGVVSNHKLMQALNDNGQRASAAPANLNVNVMGANGDDHVRALVRQGVGQALSQYNEQQRRVGFGETQKRFVAQKG
ncbi:phage tail length tape measure family protein [Ensifer adhaerens]|uniref:phage tail length tape measure family protein n=1 Tax=Ensifer adhaerens TaxID=106592 RepID=UPI00384B3A21